jgi:purine-binding chemotaxis protein CheW
VIPVVSLRSKFSLEAAERNYATCIIVVEVLRGGRKINIGIVVDRVTEVLFINGEQIDEPPSFDPSVNVEFILGIGKVGDKIKILLDIDRVLSAEDLTGLSQVQKQVSN